MKLEIETGLFDFIGPSKILIIHNDSINLLAYVVVDSVAAGPSIGGIRIAPDVTLHEVIRLARAMTMKNISAGLPHGGGKSGIIANPNLPKNKKERLIRSFARGIRNLEDYIPG